MSKNVLLWTYLIHAVLLIIHEIDSAYWQEWKLIGSNDKNGINGFLIMHFPMISAVLIGLVLVTKGEFAGFIFSLFLAASGIFAFFFHLYHLRKGRPEFNTILSKGIIFATCMVSIFQLILTMKLMV